MIPETLRPRHARAALLVASALASIAFVAALPGSGAAATTTPTFAPPVYVDQHLAGGEPEVFADTLHGRLIYSSHDTEHNNAVALQQYLRSKMRRRAASTPAVAATRSRR